VALFAALRKNLERQLPTPRLTKLLGVSAQHLTVLHGRSAEDSKSELLPQRVLSRTKALRDLVTPEFSKFAPIVVKPRSYLRNVARALRERHDGSSSQKVESRFGFLAGDVERWYGAATQLAVVKQVRGNKVPRRKRGRYAGLAFAAELTPAEWEFAEAIQSRLCELLAGAQKTAVVQQLQTALTQRANGHSDLWFAEVAPAREFLGFVNELRVADERVRFLHHPREPDDGEQWRSDRVFWAETLGVSAGRVVQASIRTSHRTSQRGVLGIQIAAVDEVMRLGRTHHSSNEPSAAPFEGSPSDASPLRVYGSAGFWVGIRFGAIMSEWSVADSFARASKS
jgi:hypothetical protein